MDTSATRLRVFKDDVLLSPILVLTKDHQTFAVPGMWINSGRCRRSATATSSPKAATLISTQADRRDPDVVCNKHIAETDKVVEMMLGRSCVVARCRRTTGSRMPRTCKRHSLSFGPEAQLIFRILSGGRLFIGRHSPVPAIVECPERSEYQASPDDGS